MGATKNGEELMVTGEVAVVLGLSIARVRQLADEGKLRATRTPGGFRIFRRADVERERRRREALAAKEAAS